MKRGELYRIEKPGKEDPKRFRVYVIVSRQQFIETNYSSVICAPVYTNYNNLLTEVSIGVDEGLRQDSSIGCDESTSLPKFALTNFIGSLSPQKIQELNQALMVSRLKFIKQCALFCINSGRKPNDANIRAFAKQPSAKISDQSGKQSSVLKILFICFYCQAKFTTIGYKYRSNKYF